MLGDKYRKWSPEISYERRIKLKRAREDDYVRQFHPKSRPILLVKQKEEFQNIRNPNIRGKKDSFYRITHETGIVKNLDEEIAKNA